MEKNPVGIIARSVPYMTLITFYKSAWLSKSFIKRLQKSPDLLQKKTKGSWILLSRFLFDSLKDDLVLKS